MDTAFKAKPVNHKALYGPLGVPKAQMKQSTSFNEFNLSYKKKSNIVFAEDIDHQSPPQENIGISHSRNLNTVKKRVEFGKSVY